MKRSKVAKRLLSLAMASAVTASLVTSSMAASVQYKANTSPMTVNSNLITCAAHAQADVTPEILGITNTTDRAGEVPATYNLDKAQSSALMGVFGTDINASPNPYLYNWVYNSYATANNLTLADKATLGGISGSPDSVDTTIVDTLGTCRSLYYRPDILIGTGGVTSGATAYDALIAALPENSDADTSNNYSPYIVHYPATVSYDFLDCLYSLANICTSITKETGKVTRYGDPLTITDNLAKYTKGLQCYVLSRLAADNKQQKTVAIVDPINSKDGVFYCVDENTSVQGTTTHSRAGEFLADTTVNIANVLGKTAQTGQVGSASNKTYYVLTAAEVLQADVIIISGVQNQDGSEASFRELLESYIDPSDAALNAKAENVNILSTRFSCCGSIGANSIENLLGMAYWTAYCYPEYLNPVYVATYWYQNFYHISDNSSLQTIIAANFADASIPSGYNYTTSLDGYNPADIESKILAGMQYYARNTDSLTGLMLYSQGDNGCDSWNVNWDTGIGSDAAAAAFTDVDTDQWFNKAVNYCYNTGIVNGVSADTFLPGDNLTRAQMAKLLYAMHGDTVAAASTFDDVSNGAWYAPAVTWAQANGIITGRNSSIFDPDSSISRQDLAVMLYRYYQYTAAGSLTGANDLSGFTDSADVASYALEAMQWAVGNGIVNGMGDNTLNPTGTATRAQAAQMLYNYLTAVSAKK